MRAVSGIEWNDWGGAAFDRAARECKPVLLSLMASWSAASAEMDRGAFADPGVVALVAGRFVPVRVDADRRPDINERYNLGGCPTTVFLTPGGDILWGATFLEPEPLRSALDQISRAYAADRDLIDQRATEKHLAPAAPAPPDAPDPGLLDWIAAQVTAPSAQPPDPVGLLFLLRRDAARPDAAAHDVLARWLDHLAADVVWERPDDNAALLTLLVEAASAMGDERLAARARHVARMLRALVSGGTIAGVDAICTIVEACLAASVLEAADSGLVAFAVEALERALGAAYRPGGGVAHLVDAPDEVRGLLVDHVRAASALLAAYAATGRLPYAMLAEELVQWSRHRLWDESGGFHDRPAPEAPLGLLSRRVKPFTVNCDAARVLCRLAALHDEEAYRRSAVLAPGADYRADARLVLASQRAVAREYGPIAAAYGLALGECAVGS